jgi:hypothetical protein
MAFDLEKELRNLKRRVDFAETRLSQLERQFGFISGQLRDIQLYSMRGSMTSIRNLTASQARSMVCEMTCRKSSSARLLT